MAKAHYRHCRIAAHCIMYKNVLLPFDGSEGAAGLLHHASELAHWSDGRIQLLYVADTTRDSLAVVENRVVDGLVQHGESVLEEAAATLDSLGTAYSTDVVQGDPAPTIADYADEYGHDLIALATHGHGGVRRTVLGSVTDRVVRLASTPVLTARLEADERFNFPYERLLVATDGSDAARRASDHACALGAALDATVHALSVVDDAAFGPDVRSLLSETEQDPSAQAAVEAVADTAANHGLDRTVTHVAHGRPDDEIIEYVEANGIDAVVMGSTGRRGTDRILLGSIAERTLRAAPVPVITVSAESAD